MEHNVDLSAKYVVDGDLQLEELLKDYVDVEVVSVSISALRSVYVVRLRESLLSSCEEFVLVG